MQERKILFFALALSGLMHLLALSYLPVFSKKVLEPILSPPMEMELVQYDIAEPTNTKVLTHTVMPTPTPDRPLTRDISEFGENEVAIAMPVPASPHVSKQAPDDEATVPLYAVSYLSNPKPEYPLVARRRNMEGQVILRVQVLSDGSSATINVKKSSGYAILDEAAQATVQRWRFVPAKQGREAVSAWVDVPIAFKLER